MFEHLIDARHHHRQHFAHVTDDQAQPRMLVERAGDRHAQQMHRGFRMPAPAGGLEHAVGAVRQARKVSFSHRLRWNVRMNVDRHVKFDRGGKEAIKARVIEEAAFGRSVDHGADETELFHGTLEFDGGGVGTLHRQRGETGKAVRAARDRGGQMIVELARERHAIGAGKQIRTRAAVGKHLHGDAGVVHRLEPDLADLGQ